MRTIIETGLFLSGGFLISILQGLILIPNILLISYKKRLFDQPDERKVHSIPVPRLGGISFFPAILVSLCLIIGLFHCVGIPIARLLTDRSLLELLFWVSGCMLLYLIGVADDLVGVGYRYKFVVQVFTAILLVLPGAWINSLGGLFGIYMLPSWVGIPLTVLIVVYITNAINLIDGMANGAAIFSGRAVGAKNGKLFAATIKMTFKWLVVLAAILMLGYHLGNEFFIRLFTNIEEVVAMAMTYNVFVLFYPVCAGIGMVLYGVFCGATQTAPVRNMMLMALLVFYILQWQLVPLWGNSGLWLALLGFMLSQSIILLFYLSSLRRKFT